MKYPILHLFLLAFLLANQSQAQQSQPIYKLTSIPLPPAQGLFTSCYVNENNRIFLPVNAGIYLPQDSVWFLPPAKSYYFTSVAPNPSDTAFFAVANTQTDSELFYVRTYSKKPPVRYALLTLEKGLYSLIFKNSACYIWGYSKGNSKIGLLVKNEIKWLFSLKGIITQVQVDNTGEIFIAVDNSIYQLGNHKRILTYQGKLYGFDIDNNQNIVLSCDQGVGNMAKDQTLNIIVKNIFGQITVRNNSIFVLPSTGKAMYKIDKVSSG